MKSRPDPGPGRVRRFMRQTAAVGLALLGWCSFAGAAGEEFVQAARARAEGTSYILFREILPNAWPPLIVEASLRVTYAILLGSALSFLGLGAQPPSSDWGLMIAEARSFLDRAPWIALAPGLAMCVLVIGINLLGDGLRERLDPRLKARMGKP